MMLLAQTITDVGIVLPSIGEVARVLTLRAGFNSALIVLGTMFLGAASGIVGSFALLRKRALIGDALSHAALPGLCVAFLISVSLGGVGRSLPVLLLGAAASGVLGVITIQFLVRHTRLTEDAAIGAVLSVFFGAGVALLSLIQSLDVGTQGGLHHFIYGQTAAMSRGDVVLTGSVALVSLIAAVALFKEFRIICFNDEFAAVQGWPVNRLDLAMMALVVIVTVIGLQTVGLILSIALLIIPAAAARFWTERLDRMMVLSALFGAASGYVGASASALLPRLPAGSVIVLASGVMFFVSFLLAPARGVIASVLRHAVLRTRIARAHVLRAIYELIEARGLVGQAGVIVARSDLAALKRWPKFELAWLASALRREGSLRREPGGFLLTPQGWSAAAALTRNHRLWEEYLVSFAHLDATHVDRSADLVEHVLSADMIAELEESLRRQGRLPESGAAPRSVHPIVAGSKKQGGQ